MVKRIIALVAVAIAIAVLYAPIPSHSNSAPSVSGTWEEFPTTPDARYWSAATLSDGEVVDAGGFSPGFGNTESAYSCLECAISPEQEGGWEAKPPLPSLQTSPAYASGFDPTDGNLPVLYVAGGNDGSGPVATLSIMEIPFVWLTLTSMPTARQEPAGAFDFDNGLFYVMGGNTGSSVTGVLEIYNRSTNSWSSGAPMITPRSDFGADTINGTIYAAGGSDGSSAALPTLEAYDPTSDSWTTLASMPTPRADLAVLAFNGLLYAIGGRGADGSPLATVEAYDPTADSWATEPSMPTARWGLAAVVAPSNLASPDQGVTSIWTLGGAVDTTGDTATNVVEVFVPPSPTATPTPTATLTPVPGELDVQPKTLNFGTVEVGVVIAGNIKSVKLTNAGRIKRKRVPLPILIEGETGATNPFNITQETCDGDDLGPGGKGIPADSCEISVSFTPGAAQKYRGTLIIETNLESGADKSVKLEGVGKLRCRKSGRISCAK